jgi:hypothetical protein
MQLLNHVSGQIAEEDYCRPVAIMEQQTIGQQIRHLIEHWQLLVDQAPAGTINYACRNRDIQIESDKFLAIDLIRSLQKKSVKTDMTLSVVSSDEKQTFSSTYYRELDHVAEHVIHHAAIIKMAILALNKSFKFPAHFGYAPSTISYKLQVCVP